MEITEVRIKLVANPSERLRAFCSITLNGDFVIRDLKIIEGVNGVFVAMPSRKLADRCPRCGCKNHLRSKFCNECGLHLKENRAPKDNQGRAKLHADIAHPINAGCRERIQNAVVEAYEGELERSKLPGYKPQSFDDFDDYDSEMPTEVVEVEQSVVQPPPVAGVDTQAAREEFSDYDSLIADLKRDAADRRTPQPASPSIPSGPPLRLPPSDGENAVGKPAYRRPPAKTADTQRTGNTTISDSLGTIPHDEEDRFGAGLV
jgi:stage V sporulation protein G